MFHLPGLLSPHHSLPLSLCVCVCVSSRPPLLCLGERVEEIRPTSTRVRIRRNAPTDMDMMCCNVGHLPNVAAWHVTQVGEIGCKGTGLINSRQQRGKAAVAADDFDMDD